MTIGWLEPTKKGAVMSASTRAFTLRFAAILLIIALCGSACSGNKIPSPAVISEEIERSGAPIQTATFASTEVKGVENPSSDTSLAPTINPGITVRPYAGPVGTAHEFELVDFTPNGLVDINAYYLATGELVLSYQVEVDNNGHGWAGIISEPGDEIGEYGVVASDHTTGIFEEGTFFIEQAGPLLIPRISISPDSGPIGTAYALELFDFTPNSLVDINTYHLPTEIRVLYFQVEVDNAGYALATIISEEGDETGEYRVVAYDQVTGLDAEYKFFTEQAVAIPSPQIRIDPSPVDFTPGDDTGSRPLIDFVWLGDDDNVRIVLQNTGGVPIKIASHEFTSPNPEDFRVGPSFIGANLQPQQSCFITLIFEPTTIGERQSTLVVKSIETDAGIAMTEVTVHGYAMFNTVGLSATAAPFTASSIPYCYELIY